MMKQHQFLLAPRLRLARPVRANHQTSATGCSTPLEQDYVRSMTAHLPVRYDLCAHRAHLHPTRRAMPLPRPPLSRGRQGQPRPSGRQEQPPTPPRHTSVGPSDLCAHRAHLHPTRRAMPLPRPPLSRGRRGQPRPSGRQEQPPTPPRHTSVGPSDLCAHRAHLHPTRRATPLPRPPLSRGRRGRGRPSGRQEQPPTPPRHTSVGPSARLHRAGSG